MTMFWQYICNWLRREEGQDLTEYALLGALIVVVVIVAVKTIGTEIQALWEGAAAVLAAHTP